SRRVSNQSARSADCPGVSKHPTSSKVPTINPWPARKERCDSFSHPGDTQKCGGRIPRPPTATRPGCLTGDTGLRLIQENEDKPRRTQRNTKNVVHVPFRVPSWTSWFTYSAGSHLRRERFRLRHHLTQEF